MTSTAPHCARAARSTGDGTSRRAVPMTGTGDGPRPDPTTLAPATRPASEGRADRRTSGERRPASNRTADDDTTQ